MEHVLDNPVWNALNTGNRHLGGGNDNTRFFDTEVSPFAGFRAGGAGDFAEMYQLTPPDRGILFVNPRPMDTPKQWQQVVHVPCLQMIYEGGADLTSYPFQHGLVDLTTNNIPEMLELTELTKPGPFNNRTIEFGHYKGIFADGQLVAMAGQRFNPDNFMEISAVCTRPGYNGRGYARELLIYHINRIQKAGQVPFLHVRDDNGRAIQVYENLGFRTRTNIHVYFFRKQPVAAGQ